VSPRLAEAPASATEAEPTVSPAARLHRSLVRRAAAAVVAGGAVLVAVATSPGPRLFAPDARLLGTGLGVLVVALALGPLTGGRVGSVLGPLVVAAGVVALPVAAGGFGVGSALVVGGGVVLGSLRPVPDDAEVVDVPAGAGRRALALIVDTGLTAVAMVVLAAAPTGAALTSTAAVYLAWVALWATVTLPASRLLGASPGAWLLGARLVAGAEGGAGRRPRWRALLARQAVRGAVGVGGFVGVLLLVLTAGVVPAVLAAAAIAAVAVAAALGVGGRRPWLDALTRSTPVVSRLETGT
jgi:hypothetical protein